MTIERRLVINADDFGLSEGVNRGILDAHDAGSAERHRGRISVEYQLHAPVPLAQIVERAGDDRASAIDDGDAIGDLIDFGDLM